MSSFDCSKRTEHERITESLNEGDILYDVFAGVGPFSVPAAKKNVIVLANDLNPESYKALKKNIELNKCKGDLKAFNLDGREFITEKVKPHIVAQLTNHIEKKETLRTVFVMNLPAIAIDFLDAFRGLLVDIPSEMRNSDYLKRPCVYCYCFSKGDTPVSGIKERVNVAMGFPLPTDVSIRLVRNVAPGKDMYCISFDLPEEVLFNNQSTECAHSAIDVTDDDEPEFKKQKLADSV